MRWLFGGLFLLVSTLSVAQDKPVSFSSIDLRVQKIDAVSLDSLSQQLTAPYVTEMEKVRSIFRWITENISYKTKSPILTRRITRSRYEEPEDTATVLKPLSERVAENVLKNREAVCDGYARLFKTLCDKAGIRSEIVNGYARSGFNRVGLHFISNHSWNAVYVDSNWRLLDVTWASGYMTYSGYEFIKKYDDYYFMTPPEQFIRDHYPDDLQWALLADPPTLEEYRRTPFKSQAFIKNRVLSFRPAKGVIEARLGDTVEVELEVAAVDYETDPLKERVPDSSLAPLERMLDVLPIIEGNRLRYSYAVVSTEVEWLNLVYREEVVMRYRLHVKPPDQTENKMAKN